jgi:hypothetical protein
MTKTTIHTRNGNIEIGIKINGINRIKLNPDDAMELGIKLLRAAYAIKAQEV